MISGENLYLITMLMHLEILMFTAVLTPKPFKTADPAVLNGRPCHLHSLGLNNSSKWLSHLKLQAPVPSHFHSFSGYNCLLTIVSSVGYKFNVS